MFQRRHRPSPRRHRRLSGSAPGQLRRCSSSAPANVPALTRGRNAHAEDEVAAAPSRAAGAKRTRREGLQDGSAAVEFSGMLDGAQGRFWLVKRRLLFAEALRLRPIPGRPSSSREGGALVLRQRSWSQRRRGRWRRPRGGNARARPVAPTPSPTHPAFPVAMLVGRPASERSSTHHPRLDGSPANVPALTRTRNRQPEAEGDDAPSRAGRAEATPARACISPWRVSSSAAC